MTTENCASPGSDVRPTRARNTAPSTQRLLSRSLHYFIIVSSGRDESSSSTNNNNTVNGWHGRSNSAMFRLRTNKFQVTEGDPIFEIRYLGCRETDKAFGTDCTLPAVSGLWLRCPYEKALPKGFLQVGLPGVSLSLGGQIVLHDIRNVSYCCVESSVNERIFAWIYRMSSDEEAKGELAASAANSPKARKADRSLQELSISSEEEGDSVSEHQKLFLRDEEGSYRFMCHAVLATKPSRAQTMAATLQRAFQVAYKDWKRDRSRDERNRIVKSFTERSLTLPRPTTHNVPHGDTMSADKPSDPALETRSLGSEGAEMRSPINGESSSFEQRNGNGARDPEDNWSLSGNE